MRRLHVLDPCSNRTTAAPVKLQDRALRNVQGGVGMFVKSAAPTDDTRPPQEPFCG